MHHSTAGRSADTSVKSKIIILGKRKENYNSGLHYSQLLKLFEEELKNIYWTEKALCSALPHLIKNATSKELLITLICHFADTIRQINRVEQVFLCIGKKASQKKCRPTKELIHIATDKLNSSQTPEMRDEEIIDALRKIEQYEIESYEMLCQFAETLQLTDALELLQITLYEEMAVHEKLSDITFSSMISRIKMEEEIDIPTNRKIQKDKILYA